jgi:galactose mutarotase-like enzyme
MENPAMTEYRAEPSTTDGYPTITLASSAAALEATFCPALGMIGCSLRHRGAELLGQRRGLATYAKSGSTMGIPLLHPWANRLGGLRYAAAGRTVEIAADHPLLHRDGQGLPMHGLLAAYPGWQVYERSAGADGARLSARLDFAADARLLAAFPFPHELRIEVGLRERTVTITTALRATGEVPVPVSFGYHPYLQLPGVPRAQWSIAVPVRQRLRLDQRTLPTGEREPIAVEPGALGARTFDDLYTDLERPARFVLGGGGRTVTVEFDEGYRFAQIYAPATDALICFEPMTAPINALVSGDALPLVAPGDEYRAAFAMTAADV